LYTEKSGNPAFRVCVCRYSWVFCFVEVAKYVCTCCKTVFSFWSCATVLCLSASAFKLGGSGVAASNSLDTPTRFVCFSACDNVPDLCVLCLASASVLASSAISCELSGTRSSWGRCYDFVNILETFGTVTILSN
jgi:hypothetical protein